MTKKNEEQPLIGELGSTLIQAIQERLTVSSGREVYAPIPYHSFEVGPITMETALQDGESPADGAARCHTILAEAMQNQFTEKMVGFFERCGQLDEYMISKGMAPRAQQETFRPNSSKPAGSQGEPMISSRQKEMILGFAGRDNIDLAAMTQNIYSKDLNYLTAKEASELIDTLNPRDGQKPSNVTSSPQGENAPSEAPQFPSDPVAKTISDMVTTKQLGMIRAISRENNLDPDEESMSVMKAKVNELSRRAASALIDHLLAIGAPAKMATPKPPPPALVNNVDDDIPF